MLQPKLFQAHKKIVDNAFCIQELKSCNSVAFIRLYDINGCRISSLIISYELECQTIDVRQNNYSMWEDW